MIDGFVVKLGIKDPFPTFAGAVEEFAAFVTVGVRVCVTDEGCNCALVDGGDFSVVEIGREPCETKTDIVDVVMSTGIRD